MSQSDRSRKLFVRSVLAGTSTLATLMGAQSLALMDNKPLDDEVAEAVAAQSSLLPTVATFPSATSTPADDELAEVGEAVEPTILKVEPSITIFRNAGSANTTNNSVANTTNQQKPSVTVMSNTNHNSVIQPPSPVELAAPDPIVIVQQPPVQQQSVQIQPQSQPQPQVQVQHKSRRSRSGSSR